MPATNMYTGSMRIEENTNSSASKAIYDAQQAAQQEAINKVNPVQKDQPAQATGTAASVDTYA
jgi:hypothetical protein